MLNKESSEIGILFHPRVALDKQCNEKRIVLAKQRVAVNFPLAKDR
jgi:hypothetical protein